MASPLQKTASVSPRNRLLWMLMTALVLGQLIAFWMVCHQQVRKAETRRATTLAAAAAEHDAQPWAMATIQTATAGSSGRPTADGVAN
jgi:hypothetical protein